MLHKISSSPGPWSKILLEQAGQIKSGKEGLDKAISGDIGRKLSISPGWEGSYLPNAQPGLIF